MTSHNDEPDQIGTKGTAQREDSGTRVPVYGWVVGIGFLVGLALVVQYSVGWGPLLAPWLQVPHWTVAGALVLVLFSYAVRTVRLHQYFSPDTRGHFPRTFRIQLLHNLFNNILPMRTGEASFPILMKRDYEVPLTRSLPGLVYLRLMDLHFLLLIGLAIFSSGRKEGWILVLLFAPLPLLAFVTQGWLRVRLAARLGGGPGGGPEIVDGVTVPVMKPGWILKLLRDSLDGLPATPSLFWAIWLWTGLNWTVKLLVFAWILQVFAPMPFPYALLGSITGEISSVLPIHGLAGAGTYEAGVMAGLLPRDLDVQAALAGAVNLHLFVLGASILSGAVAILIPIRDRNPSASIQDEADRTHGLSTSGSPPPSHG